MTDLAAAQAELTELLGLTHAPVAISFLATEPDGAVWFDEPMSEPTEDGRSGRVPAACVFWDRAHTSSFVTKPADHGNCSVGLFTHGLAGPEDIMDKSDVGALLDVGWVTMEAFGGVAYKDSTPAAIGYGPLAESDGSHDVVLLRVTPKQMMEIGDAIPTEMSGKPQCQIVPRAADQNVVAVSMGCALSRARIGMGDDELTCAVPAGRLEELLTGLREVCRADDAVVSYATADKARF